MLGDLSSWHFVCSWILKYQINYVHASLAREVVILWFCQIMWGWLELPVTIELSGLEPYLLDPTSGAQTVFPEPRNCTTSKGFQVFTEVGAAPPHPCYRWVDSPAVSALRVCLSEKSFCKFVLRMLITFAVTMRKGLFVCIYVDSWLLYIGGTVYGAARNASRCSCHYDPAVFVCLRQGCCPCSCSRPRPSRSSS